MGCYRFHSDQHYAMESSRYSSLGMLSPSNCSKACSKSETQIRVFNGSIVRSINPMLNISNSAFTIDMQLKLEPSRQNYGLRRQSVLWYGSTTNARLSLFYVRSLKIQLCNETLDTAVSFLSTKWHRLVISWTNLGALTVYVNGKIAAVGQHSTNCILESHGYLHLGNGKQVKRID